MNHDRKIERLATLYVKEFMPHVKRYILNNYFTYEHYNKVDIIYYESETTKVIHTLEFNITSDAMLNNVINDNSIKRHLTKEVI